MSSATVKAFTNISDIRRREFLLHNPLFKSVESDLLELLIESSHIRHITAGKNIYATGDMPTAMYAVIKGRVRASTSTADGREALLAVFNEGAWFGESSLLEGTPRTYQADAEVDSDLLIFPRETLIALLDSRPDLCRHLLTFLCQRIRFSMNLLKDNALLSLEEKTASRLLMLAQDASNSPTTITLSQEGLAQMLGTSRQSINKILRKWEASGLIDLRYGSIAICDHAALKRLSLVD